MSTTRTRLTALTALAAAVALPLAPAALAAPTRSVQHPPTFVVDCEGVGPVVAHEATGAAGFVAGGTPGATYVIVSAAGTLYAGTEPSGVVVGSFAKTWGTRAGMETVTCTRVDTDVVDGQPFTVSEVFVVGVVPRR